MQLGRFELVERIGSGRLAQVYRAIDAGRQVAVKLLAPDAELDDPAARERFMREIRVLEQVRHPNVIELLDHGFDDELGPYLVTPLIEGDTLRALLARGPVIPEIALLIAHEIAAGVGALHRAGIVHRDLKPENVMVRADGSVVVLDLGLAYHSAQTRLTEEGAVAGSVPYMAPEQIESESMSPATDVWALGVIFYECLVGERPFGRARRSEEVAQILSGRYTPASEQNPRIDEAHDALVARCLQPAPADRFSDAGTLAASIAGQFDWFTAKGLAAQVRMALQNPADYTETVSTERAHRLARQAETEINAGRVFAATRLLERALAYRPGDPQLEGMVERMLHTPAKSARSILSYVLVGAVVGAIALGIWKFATTDDDTPQRSAQAEHRDTLTTSVRSDAQMLGFDAAGSTSLDAALPSLDTTPPMAPAKLARDQPGALSKPPPTRHRTQKPKPPVRLAASKPTTTPHRVTKSEPPSPKGVPDKTNGSSPTKPTPANKPRSPEQLARLACHSSYLRPHAAVKQFANWANEARRKAEYAKIASESERTYALRDAAHYREKGLKYLWTWKRVVEAKKRMLDRQAPRLHQRTLCDWYQAKISVETGRAILRREGILNK